MGKALLIGINAYKNLSDLRGCVNDTELIGQLLREHFGFDDRDIRTLEDSEAILDNVVDGMDWLYREAGPDEPLLLHFSGHGSYVADDSGDEPYDELLCLHDMDWSERTSYLLDDDLRRWTRDKPESSTLTVILDCCHSGSGTREVPRPGDAWDGEGDAPLFDPVVTLARSMTRSRDLERIGRLRGASLNRDLERFVFAADRPNTSRAARAVSLVRFAPPPVEIQLRVERRRSVRGLLSTRDGEEAEMNHVALSGCQDDQKSHDAFIDTDYYGAFTKNLFDVLDEAPTRAIGEVVREVTRRLSDERYNQTPKLEPNGVSGTFLRARPRPIPKQSRPAGSGLDSGDLSALVASVRDLTEAIRESGLPRTLDAADGLRAADIADVRAGERCIVYVHGIGRHVDGFSNSWWSALTRYRENRGLRDRRRFEVVWADLVNARQLRSRQLPNRDTESTDEMKALAQELRAYLNGRYDARLEAAQSDPDRPELRGDPPTTGSPDLPRAVRGAIDLGGIDDFVRYMLQDETRDAILSRFFEIVGPLLRRGAVLDVISHSWGAVVAYEGLRALAGRGSSPGRVANLFTVGAALSIPMVRWNLFGRTTDGRRPAMVDRWINLDADWDPVGGAISTHYEVPRSRDFVGLEPFGCRAGWFGVVDPTCSHGSYFHETNRVTNVDIFGRFMAED